MQADNEFYLSELYLACRTLGARHELTHTVLMMTAMMASPDFTRAVMNAPQTFGDAQIIPFRRNPIDLRFACALVGSSGHAARQGFIICSDDALGYMGALGINTNNAPYYSLHEKPNVVAILEEHDIFAALDALSLPGITQAIIRPDAQKPDRLHINLPARLLGNTKSKSGLKDLSGSKFRIFPVGKNAETLTDIQVKTVNMQNVTLTIGSRHLMVCHHAGMQGLPFELVTPEFVVHGTFPDMLDTPRPYTVNHWPVGLFHGIFKGLDKQLITLPDDTAQALRNAVSWLKQPEHAR